MFIHWKGSVLVLKRYFTSKFPQYGSMFLHNVPEYSFQGIGIMFVLFKALQMFSGLA